MEIANVFEHVSKEKFRSAANKLLGECFLLKKHKDTASDYNYILNNKDAFTEYFEVLGYEVIIDEQNGVIGLNNPAGYNLAGKPKVLPNAKFFAINLNLYTGKIPDWILYHPHLMEWAPEILVFNQDTELTDMEGRIPGFSNVPESPDYYYEAYPLKKPEYYDQY